MSPPPTPTDPPPREMAPPEAVSSEAISPEAVSSEISRLQTVPAETDQPGRVSEDAAVPAPVVPAAETATSAERDALLVCIEPRRYVIVRHDGPQRLRPLEGGWDALCHLQPGDRVIYEGTPTTVKAIEVY